MSTKQQKKVILFDCHTFDVGAHGTTTYLQGIINNLEHQKENIEIVCCSSSKKNIEKYLNVPFKFYKSYKNFILRNVISIPFISIACNADFVVSQYIRPLFCRGKTISCIHDVLFIDFKKDFSIFFRFSRTLFYGLSAKFSDYIITTSNYTTNRIIDVFNVKRSKIHLTTCEANFSKAETLINSNEIKLLTVSRFEKRKRLELSIKALEYLKERNYDVSLTIVGSGSDDYYKEIKEIIKTNKCKESIVHLENIDDDMLESVYQQSHIFLFPSKSEGFGIPVIEALSTNTIPIVANNTALKEIEIVGEFFNTEDEKEFFEKIKIVIDNYEQYLKKLDLSSDTLLDKYSWKYASGVFLKIFRN